MQIGRATAAAFLARASCRHRRDATWKRSIGERRAGRTVPRRSPRGRRPVPPPACARRRRSQRGRACHGSPDRQPAEHHALHGGIERRVAPAHEPRDARRRQAEAGRVACESRLAAARRTSVARRGAPSPQRHAGGPGRCRRKRRRRRGRDARSTRVTGGGTRVLEANARTRRTRATRAVHGERIAGGALAPRRAAGSTGPHRSGPSVADRRTGHARARLPRRRFQGTIAGADRPVRGETVRVSAERSETDATGTDREIGGEPGTRTPDQRIMIPLL